MMIFSSILLCIPCMFEDTYIHLVGILYVYMIVQSCNLTILLAVILHVGPEI